MGARHQCSSGRRQAIHSQDTSKADPSPAAKLSSDTTEQWTAIDLPAEEGKYQTDLKSLDTVALGDIAKLEAAPTLAAKIELYLWAAWIKSHRPGVSGLQIGSELAKRLKGLGVESLAGVTFDTSSWVFMNHKPEGQWEDNLRNWARDWSQPLTK